MPFKDPVVRRAYNRKRYHKQRKQRMAQREQRMKERPDGVDRLYGVSTRPAKRKVDGDEYAKGLMEWLDAKGVS